MVFFQELDEMMKQTRQAALDVTGELLVSVEKAKRKVYALFESITDGFFVLDNEWRFTYLNTQAEKLWQAPRKNLLGKIIWEEYPNAIDSIFYQQYHYALTNMVEVHFEALSPALGIWTEIHAYPSEEGLLVFFQDITDKKKQQEFFDLLSNIERSSTDAIITGKIDGTVSSWNHGAEVIYGYTAEEVVGKHIKCVFPEDRHQNADEILGRVASGETISNHYAIHKRKTGENIVLSCSIFPLRGTNGQVMNYSTIMRDITKTVQLEQELHQFFNIATDIMIITDLEGNILRTNHAFEKILGYTGDEIKEHLISDFIYPEDCEKAIWFRESIVRKSQTVTLFEVRYFHKNGSVRWLQWNAVPVIERKLIFAVARDVTEKKELEKELLRSKRRLDKMLKSIKDGFFILDNHWKFAYVNEVAGKIAGYASETLIGANIWEKFPSGENAVIYKQFHEAAARKSPLRFEALVPACGKWYEFYVYPTSDDGLLAYFYDITDVVSMKQQIQRLDSMQLVSQMAAGISHEVRNPLTIVRGFLQILLENAQFHEYIDVLDVMISELDRANDIITEFLDLARNKPMHLQMMNVNSIIQRISPLLEASASSSGNKLLIELGEVPDILVSEKEIRQLLLNLVRNAFDAMPTSGEVIVTTEVQDQHIILAVRDQGHGIPQEIMDRIGTPFFTTKENGTGLGLATCFGIAARHNAVIQIFSTPGEGTCFYVKFKTS